MCKVMDGTGQQLELWDTLHARARLKTGTAAGMDGVTPDIYRELPLAAIFHVHDMFAQRARGLGDVPESVFWKILLFAGLPKAKFDGEFSSLRWICKSSVLQKWFLHAVRPRLRKSIRPSSVHSYGFQEGASTVHESYCIWPTNGNSVWCWPCTMSKQLLISCRIASFHCL